MKIQAGGYVQNFFKGGVFKFPNGLFLAIFLETKSPTNCNKKNKQLNCATEHQPIIAKAEDLIVFMYLSENSFKM